MAYASEQEARNDYLVALLGYVGVREGTALHSTILSDYNQIVPLPRQYRAAKTDSWCAIFLSGQGWKLGYRSWPWECSCSRIREEAGRRGIWREGWTGKPGTGDWILYDWGGDGAPDHIGAVCAVIGDTFWVVEGNYDDSVKIRRIQLGDGRVEGSVALDFTELVRSARVDGIPGERFQTIGEIPEWANPTIRKMVDRGLLRGTGEGLDLSLDMIRIYVTNDRAGLYD